MIAVFNFARSILFYFKANLSCRHFVFVSFPLNQPFGLLLLHVEEPVMLLPIVLWLFGVIRSVTGNE